MVSIYLCERHDTCGIPSLPDLFSVGGWFGPGGGGRYITPPRLIDRSIKSDTEALCQPPPPPRSGG